MMFKKITYGEYQDAFEEWRATSATFGEDRDQASEDYRVLKDFSAAFPEFEEIRRREQTQDFLCGIISDPEHKSFEKAIADLLPLRAEARLFGSWWWVWDQMTRSERRSFLPGELPKRFKRFQDAWKREPNQK